MMSPDREYGHELQIYSSKCAAGCRTAADTECLDFNWVIEGFTALRECAKIDALPQQNKDCLRSNEFGNETAGYWHLFLYPNGECDSKGHVGVYLSCDKKAERPAEFSITVLDADGSALKNRKRTVNLTAFSQEKPNWGWAKYLAIEKESDLNKFLFDDVLKIQLSLKVFTGVSNSQIPQFRSQRASRHRNLASDFEDFINTTKISDIRVVCGKRRFEANRLLLAARSKVFRAMLYGEFKEAEKNKIVIDDVSAEVVSNLLDFVLTDDCELLHLKDNNSIKELISLFETAARYEIKALHDACINCLIDQVRASTVF